MRKPVFFVEVRPFEATSEYTGCISWNSYVSDSYDFVCLIFTLLRTWTPGMLKTRGYPWFCGSNGCRRAYFGLSMESNAPTKLSIYFGQSLLPLVFFELEQSGRRDLLDLLTKAKCYYWWGGYVFCCTMRKDVNCLIIDVYNENLKRWMNRRTFLVITK